MSALKTFIYRLVTSRQFNNIVTFVILLNAVSLGLLVDPRLSKELFFVVSLVDNSCLVFFCIEILLKLFLFRQDYFKSGWRTFDFLVVVISLLPSTGPLSILRCFRILRVLMLVNTSNNLKLIISSVLLSIKGMFWILILSIILFYIFSVIGTALFSGDIPEYFGNIQLTFLTLFRVMTLDSWHEVASEVSENHPYGIFFFVSFIVLSAFVCMNIFTAILVNGMEMAMLKQSDKPASGEKGENIYSNNSEAKELINKIEEIKVKLDSLEKCLDANKTK